MSISLTGLSAVYNGNSNSPAVTLNIGWSGSWSGIGSNAQHCGGQANDLVNVTITRTDQTNGAVQTFNYNSSNQSVPSSTYIDNSVSVGHGYVYSVTAFQSYYSYDPDAQQCNYTTENNTGPYYCSIATGSGQGTPNAFSLGGPVPGAAINSTNYSNTITVAGINVPVAISITGGSYSINGGVYTTASATVTNGQTVQVALQGSGANHTTTSATLTIGGVSSTFQVTTGGVTLNQGIGGPFNNVSPSAILTSNTVSLGNVGSNVTAIIYSSNATAYYSLNGAAMAPAASQPVNGLSITNGNTLQIQASASPYYSQSGQFGIIFEYTGGISADDYFANWTVENWYVTTLFVDVYDLQTVQQVFGPDSTAGGVSMGNYYLGGPYVQNVAYNNGGAYTTPGGVTGTGANIPAYGSISLAQLFGGGKDILFSLANFLPQSATGITTNGDIILSLTYSIQRIQGGACLTAWSYTPNSGAAFTSASPSNYASFQPGINSVTLNFSASKGGIRSGAGTITAYFKIAKTGQVYSTSTSYAFSAEANQ